MEYVCILSLTEEFSIQEYRFSRTLQIIFPFFGVQCWLLEVKLYFSSAYHPQSNSQVEYVNKILENDWNFV